MANKRRRTLSGQRSTLVLTKGSAAIPWRRVLLSAAAVVFALVTVWFWFSSFLKVNIITVQGVEVLSAEQIRSDVSGLLTGNIFSINERGIRNALVRQYALISDITFVRKYFPNSLELTIIEKKPVIAWHTGYGIYGVDVDGRVTGIASTEGLIPVYAFGASPVIIPEGEQGPIGTPAVVSTGIPVLKEGDSVAETSFISYLLDIHRLLPQQMEDTALYYTQGEHHDLSVHLTSGIRVLFSTDFTLQSELKRLSDTLEESVNQGKVITDRVDLRFQKVYFE